MISWSSTTPAQRKKNIQKFKTDIFFEYLIDFLFILRNVFKHHLHFYFLKCTSHIYCAFSPFFADEHHGLPVRYLCVRPSKRFQFVDKIVLDLRYLSWPKDDRICCFHSHSRRTLSLSCTFSPFAPPSFGRGFFLIAVSLTVRTKTSFSLNLQKKYKKWKKNKFEKGK